MSNNENTQAIVTLVDLALALLQFGMKRAEIVAEIRAKAADGATAQEISDHIRGLADKAQAAANDVREAT